MGLAAFFVGLFCLWQQPVLPAAHGKICLNFDAVGDSITDASTGGTWPAAIAAALSSTGTNDGVSSRGWNYGAGSSTLIELGPTVDGHLASLSSGCSSPTLFLFAGTNDIALNASTGAQTYGFFQTYIAARIASGWNATRMVVVTMLPRNSTDTNRASYNTALIGGAVTYGYRLSRLDLDPNIGCTGCNLNTTYYTGDQIHPNATGQQIIANLNCLAMGLPSVSCPIY